MPTQAGNQAREVFMKPSTSGKWCAPAEESPDEVSIRTCSPFFAWALLTRALDFAAGRRLPALGQLHRSHDAGQRHQAGFSKPLSSAAWRSPLGYQSGCEHKVVRCLEGFCDIAIASNTYRTNKCRADGKARSTIQINKAASDEPLPLFRRAFPCGMIL